MRQRMIQASRRRGRRSRKKRRGGGGEGEAAAAGEAHEAEEAHGGVIGVGEVVRLMGIGRRGLGRCGWWTASGVCCYLCCLCAAVVASRTASSCYAKALLAVKDVDGPSQAVVSWSRSCKRGDMIRNYVTKVISE
jgi:hypothetical protein